MADSVKRRGLSPALIDALKASLPAERAALVDSSGRAERFEDNLVASLSAEQIAKLRAQLGAETAMSSTSVLKASARTCTRRIRRRR